MFDKEIGRDHLSLALPLLVIYQVALFQEERATERESREEVIMKRKGEISVYC